MIKRFNESNMIDISTDRSLEMIELLSKISKDILENLEKIESLSNELEGFRSKSTTSNDQIDDSVSNLEMIKNALRESLDKIDNTSINMKDYLENGRKYMY